MNLKNSGSIFFKIIYQSLKNSCRLISMVQINMLHCIIQSKGSTFIIHKYINIEMGSCTSKQLTINTQANQSHQGDTSYTRKNQQQTKEVPYQSNRLVHQPSIRERAQYLLEQKQKHTPTPTPQTYQVRGLVSNKDKSTNKKSLGTSTAESLESRIRIQVEQSSEPKVVSAKPVSQQAQKHKNLKQNQVVKGQGERSNKNPMPNQNSKKQSMQIPQYNQSDIFVNV